MTESEADEKRLADIRPIANWHPHVEFLLRLLDVACEENARLEREVEDDARTIASACGCRGFPMHAPADAEPMLECAYHERLRARATRAESVLAKAREALEWLAAIEDIPQAAERCRLMARAALTRLETDEPPSENEMIEEEYRARETPDA